MKFLRRNRCNNQRGATLTGYALVVASMAAGSLGAISTLEDNSGQFLSNSGAAIGAPRESASDLAGVAFSTPDGWTPPTAPGSTNASTTAPTSSTSTTLAPTTASTAPTTAAPTTAPPPTFASTSVVPTTAAPTTTTPPTTTPPTTTPVPVAFEDTAVEVEAGGCIFVNKKGWILRKNKCGNKKSELTSTHLPNGNVILSSRDGDCFQPWDGDDETWVDTDECTGDNDQEWWVIPVGDSFMYQNVDSGQCLDMTRDSGGKQFAVMRDCDTDDEGQILFLY